MVLSFLEDIFSVVLNLPAYVLYAAEELVNALFSVVQAAFDAASALLPSLPEVTAPPSYVTDVNWFFPLTTVVGLATGMMAAYIAWLAIRWIFSKVGQL